MISMLEMLGQVRDAERAIAQINPEVSPEEYSDLLREGGNESD